MSTLKVNSIEPANAGSEDYFLARAWVDFNSIGTVAIRADGNVSSMSDNGSGDFTTNFSSALTDGNYAFLGCVGNSKNAAVRALTVFTTSDEGATPYTKTSTAVRHVTAWGGTSYDTGQSYVQVAR